MQFGHCGVSNAEMGFFCKVEEANELRGGIQPIYAQAIPQIDVGIAKKIHFRMETN